MDFNDIKKTLKNPKFQWGIVVILLIIAIIWSSSIRLSNWDLLTDQTSGEKIPLALDPYYFLRLAENLVENGGIYPEYDSMRNPSAKIGFVNEIMPQATILIWKVSNLFGDYSIQEANIFSPVLFYILGMILFFFLTYALTNSKLASIISSIILAFIPAYLYRTMAGFSDHESLGMVGFFGVLLIFALALKYIDKKKETLNIILFGIGTGILSAFTLASWAGLSTFVYMILPLSFLIFYLTKINHDKSITKKSLIFYLSWFISAPLIWVLMGFPLDYFIQRTVLSTTNLINPLILVILIIDLILIKNSSKIKFIKQNLRIFYSVAISFILGLIGLLFSGKNIFSVISGLWNGIFTPWGTGRVGLTVAENAQPYLTQWIGQISPIIFWMFFAGMIMIGISFSKSIKKQNKRGLTVFIWVLFISGILFSRISASSLMNGENFISKSLYILSILITLIYFVWLYIKEDLKISPEIAIIASWMFITLIAGRSAQRTFFTITPFVTFSVGYLVFKIYSYFKAHKDELIRPIMIVLLIVSLLAGVYSVYNFERGISTQAQNTGPSANYQWQNAMSWIRENTPEGSIFSHWWDYGYWVQTLGKRPALTDGGHAVTYWDHLIGRYVLTSPNPDAAYSFLKSHDVSYFLIDPTDVGKYPAYSRIGSGEDGNDRYSAIPTMVMDPKQTVEKSNETILVYQGGMFVDEDIEYTFPDGRKIFLPQEKANIGAVIWRLSIVNESGSTTFDQPTGVFLYNNQRYDIPIRYIYVDNQLIDTGSGIEAVLRIIPQYNGQGLMPLGAAIYLSPKVASSFMAQNYLLNNAFGNYDDMKLVHSELDVVVQSLKSQGAPLDEFVYYNGFRGPIKIWEIGYSEDIKTREEFLRTRGDWAEFDNLEFVEAN